MSIVSVNGLDIHYWRIGHGPDVVMLHGLLGNLAVWHLKIAPMLQREFRVTTYDQRGHGFSQMPATGYSTRDMALELEGLLEALEMERVYLVGHSYGADIALHFALLRPQRVQKLVLLDAGGVWLVDERKRPDWEGWDYWTRKLNEVGIEVPSERRTDFRYLLNLSLNTPKFYGPAKGLPRKREPLLRLINTTTLIEDYEIVDGITPEKIRALEVPSLVIYGENSHFLGTYRFLQEALRNSQSLLVPGGEHFGPLEHPELLVEHMHSFFLAGAGRGDGHEEAPPVDEGNQGTAGTEGTQGTERI